MRSLPLSRVVVTWLTYGLLGVAFVLGVLWFCLPEYNRWEPAVNTLTMVAGLTGIFLERFAAAADRREQVLHAAADELAANERILSERFRPDESGRSKVFPRLAISAVDLAVVSGALDHPRDTELVGLLHGWRDTVVQFNRRLDLTEMRTFIVAASDSERRALHDRLHSADGFLAETRDKLAQLTASLHRRRRITTS